MTDDDPAEGVRVRCTACGEAVLVKMPFDPSIPVSCPTHGELELDDRPQSKRKARRRAASRQMLTIRARPIAGR